MIRKLAERVVFWCLDKAVGAAARLWPEAEQPPADPVEHPYADDEPLVGAEALAMIAGYEPVNNEPALSEPPPTGSLAERRARLGLR